MTVIPIVIGAFGTITKGLVKGLEDLEMRGKRRRSRLHHYSDWQEY